MEICDACNDSMATVQCQQFKGTDSMAMIQLQQFNGDGSMGFNEELQPCW